MLSKPYSLIRKELDEVEVCLRKVSETTFPLLSGIESSLISAGGKRLRPALFLLAARMAKKDDFADIVPLAASLELIHVASLIHDDVIDNSLLRRGKETANAKYGNHVAVLAGDYLFASAFGLISDKDYPRIVGGKIVEIVKLLAVGEIQQDSSLYKITTDEEAYYCQIEKKTAAFMAVCCEIGALVEGIGTDIANKLYNYGHNLGMAFQITDDLLDVTSNDETLGKPAGRDIKQGVITLPVIYALKYSLKKERLAAIISNPLMSEGELQEAVMIVRECEGIARSKKKIQEYVNKAKSFIPEECSENLRESFDLLADYILKRNY